MRYTKIGTELYAEQYYLVVHRVLINLKELKKKHGKTKEQQILDNIRKKFQENNLIIVKADKEQTITIMKKSMYIDKVKTFRTKQGFKKIKNNPLNNYTTKIKKVINKCKATIKELNRSKFFVPMNLKMPKPFRQPNIIKWEQPFVQ